MPTPQFDRPLALKDQVYRILRARVRQGDLTPQDRLVDATLARDMNISRTPVREALQLMVHEGLLDTTTRGFKLSELDQTEVGHLFELRLLLEPTVAAKSAMTSDRKGADRLVACIAQAAKRRMMQRLTASTRRSTGSSKSSRHSATTG
ncbi:GntR family transcriptional regulator [Sulfitobacter porphyrae]|uniref:GntR family transcriptional regulator n=1 Tax=Sulfitobacter porphyrae TaxID=1246864 RepID=A0ABW2BD07_9RHOB